MREITIVSGGQTGADRAALDFALEFGLAHGGWCPRGRKAEDGVIDERYQLQETTSPRYDQRTRWNVRDSDATVVFSIGSEVTGGTALTLAIAEQQGKPLLHLSSEAASAEGRDPAHELIEFLAEHRVGRLNVAGPRASQEPLVAAFVRGVLVDALDRSAAKE
ncbi:MAG: putative molybdenum carrier protein [Pirellulales bacterium]